MERRGSGVTDRIEQLVGCLLDSDSNEHIARIAAAASRLFREGEFPSGELANRLLGIMHLLPLGFMFPHDAWLADVRDIEGSFRRWFDTPAYGWKCMMLTGNEPERLTAMDRQDAAEE